MSRADFVEPRPFPLQATPIHVPDAVLADLRQRLASTRWPDDAGNDDGYYGIDRRYLRELVEYWHTDYDWRTAEAAINAHPHGGHFIPWEIPAEHASPVGPTGDRRIR
ncbi:epoxide hydrolase N-terminal domain-containing protein [Nocardia sp. NBC_00565]|uniref:epoxide hydrolase N-terminal domain-containing protein n=1 Tax=Nocardia sp. NBC_00565 TaxID=2975993 RepID=UPI002E80D401|nr:epoxide hydrolase N-terminal domain-containing protein [Nocardia sp. NBC_00565]WUC00441.1 epoxide hydrolase N-terminal domain-containing protein [Nocardia sp. NBC_00565]